MNAHVPAAAVRRRAMLLGDLDAVAAIEASAYGFPWSRGNFVDALAAGHLAEVLEAGRPLGYFVALPGADELHLLNITVAPHWQGRGLGTALLEAVATHARERGLARVWLEVRASNVRAQALYARRGYATVGCRRSYYPAAGAREDAVLMSLEVPAERA
ncbi:MAG TPA: ribosomal protein S18-alanine N-acetyltransferase [Rubrivivax sp.]|nr:ribosomal protein S18-alanine N-acetyltransferase [Rubrivivax sp.]